MWELVQDQQRPERMFLMKSQTDGRCHSLHATQRADYICPGSEHWAAAAVVSCIPVSQQQGWDIRASFSLAVSFKSPTGEMET